MGFLSSLAGDKNCGRRSKDDDLVLGVLSCPSAVD
jgi:hypothetical protein